MISTLLAASVLAVSAPKDATMRIAGASMFKNGYVVVLREMDVPASGTYLIKQIPQGSLGTVWMTGTEGTKLKEVINSLSDVQTKVNSDLGSLDQILAANKGKVLEFEVEMPENKRIWTKGKLLMVSGELAFAENEGEQFTLRRKDILTIKSKEKLVYSVNQVVTTKVRGLRFEVETAKPGKVFMVSLERGITWVPAFSLDISDSKKLVLTAKATAINDLEDMAGSDFRFVTGFPNIRFADITDPLLSNATADQFLGTISGGFGGSGGGAGGPGGPARSRASEMMNQKAAAPMMADAMGQVMDMEGEGMQAGDLFFYTKSDMSLKKGERGMYMLFQSEAPYKEVYTWLVEDQTVDNVEYRFPSGDPGEVWHSIRFRNTSGQPLTTSATTTFKNGQILGQDMMTYTPNGAETEVRVTKALDVRVEKNEEELKKEIGVIKEKVHIGGNVFEDRPLYDRLHIKGTLVIRNLKAQKVTMKVAKNLTGEVASASHDAKIVKLAKGIRDMNPSSVITWQLDVESGKAVSLNYEFSIMVKSPR